MEVESIKWEGDRATVVVVCGPQKTPVDLLDVLKIGMTIQSHIEGARTQQQAPPRPPPVQPVPPVQSRPTYGVGGTYDGVAITLVQESEKGGYGVLTLADGSKVKYELGTLTTLAVKPPPEAPATDQGQLPPPQPGDLARELAELRSLRDVVSRLMTASPSEGVVGWAVANCDSVPALKRIGAAAIPDRIERLMEAMK